MRLLVHLSNAVPAFQPDASQLTVLRVRLAHHAIHSVDTEDGFLAALPDAEGVVVWRFLSEWYARAPALRHVFTPSAGREPFAPDASGRVLLHFGRFHGAIMAESLLAMLSFMNRRFGAALRAQGQQRWDRAPYSKTRALRGQTLLVIGYGAIGQQCGRLAASVGLRVHAMRRDPLRPCPAAERVFTPDQLGQALALADHVVCVLPGDTGTDQLLDAAAFAQMKPNACVYNLGRGNAIHADGLLHALSEGRIAGAFLDVQPEEPLPASSPLWSAPNLYLTPHSSAIRSDYLDLYFEELGAELTRVFG